MPRFKVSCTVSIVIKHSLSALVGNYGIDVVEACGFTDTSCVLNLTQVVIDLYLYHMHFTHLGDWASINTELLLDLR